MTHARTHSNTLSSVARATSAIRRKIERIRAGGSIRTLDLFAGCGGLSLGFSAAGFAIVAAVENDRLAAASHAINFSSRTTNGSAVVPSPNAAHDISSISPADLVQTLGLGKSVTGSIDVIIGGPPCQAYARVGRAKLREIDQHPEAFLRDTRANLYLRYLHYVREMCPLAIVMENVPDALNFGGHNICEEMCEVLSSEGYVCGYTLLNSAFYGVPQMRERVFLFAYRKELFQEFHLPAPSHFVALPAGYQGSRAVALKSLSNRITSGMNSANTKHFFVQPPEASPILPKAITAKQATEDLPAITGHLNGTIRRGTRRLNEPVPYSKDFASLNPYCKLMRDWPGLQATDHIVDHVIRSLPRDYQIFREMKPGDQYPEAHALALKLFRRHLARLAKTGVEVKEDSREFERIKKAIVPPYDPGKFPNKWRKMEPDLPARTLLAHLGKDSYSHIHYDSEQARTISVREAARLQSFPDGFCFSGTMNPAFRQIGNAVPPLLANAVAHAVLSSLGVSSSKMPLNTSLT